MMFALLASSTTALASEPAHLVAQPDRFGVVLADGRVIKPRPWWNPYAPNRLKGDRPIAGDHTYFIWTTVADTRAVGGPQSATTTSQSATENLTMQAELFHGETVFRPKDWSLVVSAVSKDAIGAKNPLPSQKTIENFTAGQTFAELLLETHGRETYDFTSARAGVQVFDADFEGLLLNDALPGARVFGQYVANRYALNVFYGRPLAKTDLIKNGTQVFVPKALQADIAVASLLAGDFLGPGFNLQVTLAADDDRRDPGRREHVGYFTVASSGHVGRIATQSALYLAAGTDDSAAGKRSILAPMAVLDLARPSNAWNPRLLVLYAPGDADPLNKTETAYDAIADKENFAGADGSGILGGLNNIVVRPGAGAPLTLFRTGSLLPTLRGANAAPNFTNPGLQLVDLGTDLSVTPRIVVSADAILFRWDQPKLLATIAGIPSVDAAAADELIGQIRWRPALNDNAIVTFSLAALIPGKGLTDLGVAKSTQLDGTLRVILAF